MKKWRVINTLCHELTIPIDDRQFYYVLFSDELRDTSPEIIKTNMRSHKLAIEKKSIEEQKVKVCREIINSYKSKNN